MIITKENESSSGAKERILGVVCCVSILAYAIYLCLLPNAITDVWWQVRLGDEIRLRHSIPSFDTYSWSGLGNKFVLHEWGSCLTFAEAYRHMGGWFGILIVELCVACATLFTLSRIIAQRCANNHVTVLVMTLLAGHLCGVSFTPRPQIFTYLFLTLSLGLLLSIRNGDRGVGIWNTSRF